MELKGMEKIALDAGAIGSLGLVFANVLPVVASAFTVIWMGIRIYETDTVQRFIKRRKSRG